MKVKFISFDSMGVRSMATLVETTGGTFFIDPGAALAPRRYGLPPHEEELEALERFLGEIRERTREVDYLVITHYHRDHYLYRNGEEEYYRGKLIYAKNPYAQINPSQRVRAYTLFKKMGVSFLAKRVLYADGSTFTVDGVRVEFSPPLPHGECGTKLGWVIAVTMMEDDYVFTHASDTQGCMCSESLNYLGRRMADLLVISGPPTYFSPRYEVPENTIKLVKSLKEGSTIVIDHHFLRDRNYIKHMERLKNLRKDVKVLTAAEYMGFEVRQLEAYRDALWGIRKHEKR
ncbi:MAG: MBL fold metallo-hydrolase [Desulfurococcaceae archaeon]